MKGMMVRLDEVEASPRKGAKVWHISKPTDAEQVSMHIVRCEPNGELSTHTHDFEEFVYAYKGSGEEVVGEERFPLKPGVLVYVPPNIPHTTRGGDEPLEIVVVYAHE